LEVCKVGLDITINAAPTLPNVANPALNGKYAIKGIFDYECCPGQCPMREGKTGTLKLSHEGKFTILPIFFIERLQVVPLPNRRRHTWYFGGLVPTIDQLDFLPTQEEITLDELIGLLGASRDMMEEMSVQFTSEGGFTC